jgi:hypothetical protein
MSSCMYVGTCVLSTVQDCIVYIHTHIHGTYTGQKEKETAIKFRSQSDRIVLPTVEESDLADDDDDYVQGTVLMLCVCTSVRAYV